MDNRIDAKLKPVVPFLAGALAKVPLKNALAHEAVTGADWIYHALSVSAFLTVLVMARFVLLTRPGGDTAASPPARGTTAPWVIAVLSVLSYPFAVALLGGWVHIADAYSWKGATAGVLPLALAGAAVVLSLLIPWRPGIRIPAGGFTWN